MKKLILPIIVCLFAFGTANATTTNVPSKEVTSYSYKVNNFCKLIQMGKYDAVKALIEAGEDVNQKSNGMTPLMFAARHNKAEIAKLLIKHGAKLKAKSDKSRLTALDLAKRSKAMDAMKVIEDALDKK
ncbi:ankyrin repeat domain-containing protein [Flavobacteriaceae bacterium S356]|uniref:Ankyrin repeat domain-containing protein n=1 Tax=Asprobacillus argus TaxID=3076534 RepID=A0ABU3LB52_9FLAO|nr:ankyrin repeat domain-containing protein [Flavobacteriaceae bacterium S356]